VIISANQNDLMQPLPTEADLTTSIRFLVELGGEDISIFLESVIDDLRNSSRLFIGPSSL
jgi:hypothetical protein